jgi:AraC-like DNA-binding protein
MDADSNPSAMLAADLSQSAHEPRNEVVHHLVSALRHASSSSRAFDRVFVGQVESALRTYLTAGPHTDTMRRSPRGGLPLWKERRIKELMRAQLAHKLSPKLLASECDLSIRHFTRAFTLSTGLSPGRYLLKLRLERARQLLTNPALPLNEVAMACGFADQSHFTRAFSAAEKMSPGAWRKLTATRSAERHAMSAQRLPAHSRGQPMAPRSPCD